MLKALTRTTLIVAAATAAAAAPASAATGLCVPTTAGQAAFSGGADAATYCASRGAKAVLMPDSVADQQKLIGMLPYLDFQSAGVGGKPTITLTGANLQIRKGSEYVSKDGTGNLIVGNGVNYKNATGRDGSENVVVGWDNDWSGNNNVVVGSFHKATGSVNIIGGRQNTATGSGNLMSGVGNEVTSHWGSISGYFKKLNQEYGVIADGAGKDVHWVRYDGTGKVIGSSGRLTYQYMYVGGSYAYSLTQWEGVDLTKCTLTVGDENTGFQWEAKPMVYFGYAYVTMQRKSGTSAPGIHTAVANCNKNPGAIG